MVDVEKLLKNTIKKGEVAIGSKQTKAVIKDGSAKMIVISNNCPNLKEIEDLAKTKKIPVLNYSSNSIDLGYACGKSYAVSVFAVLSEGEANILQLNKKGSF